MMHMDSRLSSPCVCLCARARVRARFVRDRPPRASRVTGAVGRHCTRQADNLNKGLRFSALHWIGLHGLESVILEFSSGDVEGRRL